MYKQDLPPGDDVPSPVSRSISVVICTHTEARWKSLVAAITSVRQQLYPAHEIIVVIDHNSRLLARARAHLMGTVVVANTQRQGLSGARNTGVATARGEIVAFLDDDALAAPDWLAQLAVGYANANVVAVGGSIKPDWQMGRPDWFPEEFDWIVGCTYQGMPQTEAAVRNLIGCNMSIRREMLKLSGGFSNIVIGRLGADSAGCEETELFIRMRQRFPSAIVLYRPEACVFHAVPATRATWHYFQARCRGEGRSKALISQLVGSRDALASERSYILRTLPRGLLRGMSESLHTRHNAGLFRSGAILSGLAITSASYLCQRSIYSLTRRKIGMLATSDSTLEPGTPDPQSGLASHGLTPGEHESCYSHG